MYRSKSGHHRGVGQRMSSKVQATNNNSNSSSSNNNNTMPAAIPPRRNYSDLPEDLRKKGYLHRFGRHAALFSSLFASLRVSDVLFLLVVIWGLWRTVLFPYSHANNAADNASRFSRPNDLLRLKQAMDASKISSKSGTVTFRGTRACNDRVVMLYPSTSSQVNVSDDDDASGLCQIHFPLDITTTSTSCRPDYCVRTFHGCGSVDQVTCHSEKHHHATLLQPLSFDGDENDQTTNVTGQLIVLADGIHERGHELAESVVLRLPMLILDPFRRYAKAHTKIKTKILTHAFSAMDIFLYNEHRRLWMDAGACTLAILQYGNALFLASTGDAAGFLAQWNETADRATILQSAVRHEPDSPSESKRIREAGGIVAQDPDLDEYRVFLHKNATDQGIRTSRAMGGGRWKYNGVIAVPSVEEIDLSQWLQSPNGAEENGLFVVAASAGIGQVHSEQTIADRIGKALFSPFRTSSTESLDGQIMALIDDSTKQWNMNHPQNGDGDLAQGSEDMTLLVSKIVSPT